MASNECFYQYVVIPLLPKDTEKDIAAAKENPCDDTGASLPAAGASSIISSNTNGSKGTTTAHPLKDCEMPDLTCYEDELCIPAAAASSVFSPSQNGQFKYEGALDLNEYFSHLGFLVY